MTQKIHNFVSFLFFRFHPLVSRSLLSLFLLIEDFQRVVWEKMFCLLVRVSEEAGQRLGYERSGQLTVWQVPPQSHCLIFSFQKILPSLYILKGSSNES